MSRARVLSEYANLNSLAVDTTDNEVGIASTVPRSTLDVRGEIKVGSGITMGIAGVATFSGTADVHLHDSVKLLVGDGSDLSIFHNATNSEIKNATGTLYLESDGTWITDKEGSDKMAKFLHDGAVELYYDNQKTFETTANGVTIYDDGKNDEARLIVQGGEGNAASLYLYADDGDDNADKWRMLSLADGALSIQNYASGSWETNIEANGDGNVELNYNNSKKFETTNNGTVTTGVSTVSNVRYGSSGGVNNWNGHPRSVVLGYSGSDYAQLGMGWTTTGTNSQYVSANTDKQSRLELQDGLTIFGSGASVASGTQVTWKEVADFKPGGIHFYGDGDQALSIGSNRDLSIYGSAAGITSVTWDASANSLIFKDNSKSVYGDDSDLSIYRSSTSSWVHHSGSGYLFIQGNDIALRSVGQENYIVCDADNFVKLYFDGSERLSTTNEGIEVTGFTSTTAGMGVTGGLFEGSFIKAGKLSDNQTLGISTANFFYFTTQETTTATPNIVWNDSYSLSSKMAVGDVASVTVVTTAAAGGYSANWTIDGNAVTEEWVGGSAPSAGGSDGLDIYSLTIIKTGTGTGDSGFKVIANLSNAT